MPLASSFWRAVVLATVLVPVCLAQPTWAKSSALNPALGVTKVSPPVGTTRDVSPFNVTLETTTIMPYMIGAGISIDGPGGLLAKTSVGGTPLGLISLARKLIGNESLYDSDLADGLLERIETPLVWRLDLGWKPAKLGGFYISAGYGFIRLGAQVEARDLPSTVGEAMPGLNDNSQAALSATLHMVNAEIGWEFRLGSHWRLRVAAGGSFTFDVGTTIRLTGISEENTAQANADANTAENVLKDTLFRFGRVPTISIALGYRSF